MITLGQWFTLKPSWLVMLVSMAGIAVGILLRKKLEKHKLAAIFIPVFLFLLAEHMAADNVMPGTGWFVLGGEATMIFLGAVLPSVLTPWNIGWK